ncbi:hypothetical protein DdX_07692 [Ditylenchus destructor]|uniref:Uncharacterized protein n=1 Tax=Ditylenchus destructor TaxID=166010 RepID=A0AAD4N552_9BILA|nr:hypothetical protein DdX_07692 [Ditylenchus destructor]
MFRLAFEQDDEHRKCKECVQTIVCVISPLYSDHVDDAIDDFISLRFNILQKYENHLSDEQVHNWFRCDDSENAAQYTNGVSTFFLLSRLNSIPLGERLGKFHNAISRQKVGKNAVYFSPNLVEALRDVRLHFPQCLFIHIETIIFLLCLDASTQNEFEQAVTNARKYVKTHLITPVCQQLADMDLKIGNQ